MILVEFNNNKKKRPKRQQQKIVSANRLINKVICFSYVIFSSTFGETVRTENIEPK